jgi:hypothetical protein
MDRREMDAGTQNIAITVALTIVIEECAITSVSNGDEDSKGNKESQWMVKQLTLVEQ